ncbi:MAG TPA: hypothetical protein VJ725_07225 [Thermoanaerobaculia bacterium]|nr:hypothetical protein [Thermoanaerobaculia bacterium]
MASYTINPIFVVKEICDLDLFGLPAHLLEKIEKVTAGQEQAGGDCSMNTKAMLVLPKGDASFDFKELEELRRALVDKIKNCKPGPDGQTE